MIEKGVSLLEAVVVLVIAWVLLTGLSLSLHGFSPKYKLLSAVWEVQSGLNMARFKAIFKGMNIRMSFKGSGYLMETYDAAAKTWRRDTERFLGGVDVDANNAPTFHGSGAVSNFASIYISNSWGKFKITVAISGRVKTIKL